jgi:hypothetical protein
VKSERPALSKRRARRRVKGPPQLLFNSVSVLFVIFCKTGIGQHAVNISHSGCLSQSLVSKVEDSGETYLVSIK